MNITQIAEKHNIDPAAFKAAVQELVSKQQTWAYFQDDAEGGVYIVGANEYHYHHEAIKKRGWTHMKPLVQKLTIGELE